MQTSVSKAFRCLYFHIFIYGFKTSPKWKYKQRKAFITYTSSHNFLLIFSSLTFVFSLTPLWWGQACSYVLRLCGGKLVVFVACANKKTKKKVVVLQFSRSESFFWFYSAVRASVTKNLKFPQNLWAYPRKDSQLTGSVEGFLFITFKPSQAYPQDLINEYIIRKLNRLILAATSIKFKSASLLIWIISLFRSPRVASRK